MVSSEESPAWTPVIVTAEILMFLKAPRPGAVKTRLAAAVGEKDACAIYRQLADRQIGSLPMDCSVSIVYDPPDSETEMKEWLGDRFRFEAQAPGALGARMESATRGAFDRGAEWVILIGGDCPELGAEDFEKCLARLRSGDDVVIGPASDGGYYLFGLSRFDPRLFADIPWSTTEVLRASEERLRSIGYRWSLLAEKEDVDDPPSLERAVSKGYVTLPAIRFNAGS